MAAKQNKDDFGGSLFYKYWGQAKLGSNSLRSMAFGDFYVPPLPGAKRSGAEGRIFHTNWFFSTNISFEGSQNKSEILPIFYTVFQHTFNGCMGFL